MLSDIVIDANILCHAENHQEIRQADCQMLISLLYQTDTALCVDDGFDLEAANNRSFIGHEYIKHLRAGSLGYAIVQHLAQSSRVSILSANVGGNVGKHILQIPKGFDRRYVKVAYNSRSKVLASHDFGDIPNTVRVRLSQKISVEILDAAGACEAMKSELAEANR